MPAVSSRAEEEADTWKSRCDGLRTALQAQEAHSEALEREIASRPSTTQVNICRIEPRLLTPDLPCSSIWQLTPGRKAGKPGA